MLMSHFVNAMKQNQEKNISFILFLGFANMRWIGYMKQEMVSGRWSVITLALDLGSVAHNLFRICIEHSFSHVDISLLSSSQKQKQMNRFKVFFLIAMKTKRQTNKKKKLSKLWHTIVQSIDMLTHKDGNNSSNKKQIWRITNDNNNVRCVECGSDFFVFAVVIRLLQIESHHLLTYLPVRWFVMYYIFCDQFWSDRNEFFFSYFVHIIWRECESLLCWSIK